MSVSDALRLALDLATFVVMLLGLVVELIKIISKKK